MNQPLQLKCPQCGKPSFNSRENLFRPFCSERCKMIDFGDWIEENHRIAGDDAGSIGEPEN